MSSDFPISHSSSSKPRFNNKGESMHRRNIWLPDKMWEEIQILGVEFDETPSEVFERLLRYWIENHPEDYDGVEL